MASRFLSLRRFHKVLRPVPVYNRLLDKTSIAKSITTASHLYQNEKLNEARPDLILSSSCIARLKEILEPQKNDFLRVVVEGGGCSGFQYKFEIDSEMTNEDCVFEEDGVKVVADETSLLYIKGSTIDFHTELIRSAFRIVQNPLADTGCSCGASFSIKM